MTKSSVLLINEPPLQVLPSLATAIGLNEAVVVQQIHYWLQHFRKARDTSHCRDGHWWVWNSYEEWRSGNFPFWSTDTIQRAFTSAERQGVLISAQLSPDRRDRRKWYTINYEALNRLDLDGVRDAQPQVAVVDDRKMSSCTPAKCHDESYTETTTETTTEIRVAAEAAPPPSAAPSPSSRKKTAASNAKDPTPQQALVGALAEVTGMDARLNGSRLGKTAAQLAGVDATPDLIRQHYGSGGYWYARDWRGQRGTSPTPEQIIETWGQWSRPAPAGNGQPRAAPSKSNGTIAAVEEYLRDLEQTQAGGAQVLDAQGRVIYG